MSSRDQIINRLKDGLANTKSIPKATSIAPESGHLPIDANEFANQLELANAQVHFSDAENYQSVLASVVKEHKINTLMASQQKLPELFEDQTESANDLNCSVIDLFQQQPEDLKLALFDQMDASITTVFGGICETGSLILIPDQQEPRSASLVAPIHIALVFESQLYGSFADFIPTQSKNNMPTNIILVSGPSKTADIQQTVAFGAHGPKQLVVIICNT